MNISVSDVPSSHWTITFFPNILIVYVFYGFFLVCSFATVVLFCNALLSLYLLEFLIFFFFSVKKNNKIYLIAIVLGPLGSHEIHQNCGLTTASNPFLCIFFVCTIVGYWISHFSLCYFSKVISSSIHCLFVCSIVYWFVVVFCIFLI